MEDIDRPACGGLPAYGRSAHRHRRPHRRAARGRRSSPIPTSSTPTAATGPTRCEAGKPLALVRARSTADVQATLRVASAHRVPVVPRGAGTGLSGGSSAIDGCITLSTERMRRIEIDPAAMVAVGRARAPQRRGEGAAREHGLWYPPDPSSFEICSIGGNLATNAGGLCCVKYGVTTDYVLGLEVVLADGRARAPRRPHDQGRRRLRPQAAVRRLGGHARRHHRGDAAAAAAAAAGHDDRRPRSPTSSPPAAPSPPIVGRRAPGGPRADGPHRVARGRGRAARWASTATLGALLLGRSDAGGGSRRPRWRSCDGLRAGAGRTYVAVTDDPDEGELLMGGAGAWRSRASSGSGTVLIEDVGVPIPRIPELVAGGRSSRGAPRHHHPGDRPRR